MIGSGGTPGATGTMTVAYTVAGVSAASISVPGVEKPANQAEFCAEANSASSPLAVSDIVPGATVVINSCTFSGSVGTIHATVTLAPVGAIAYVLTFTFH